MVVLYAIRRKNSIDGLDDNTKTIPCILVELT